MVIIVQLSKFLLTVFNSSAQHWLFFSCISFLSEQTQGFFRWWIRTLHYCNKLLEESNGKQVDMVVILHLSKFLLDCIQFISTALILLFSCISFLSEQAQKNPFFFFFFLFFQKILLMIDSYVAARWTLPQPRWWPRLLFVRPWLLGSAMPIRMSRRWIEPLLRPRSVWRTEWNVHVQN